MSIDPFGNPAIGGLYRGGAGNAGGKDLPPSTSFNGFVASYDEAGALRWQLPLNSTGELFPRSASTNGSGNTGVAGHFTGTLSIGSMQLDSVGGKDAFYVRANDSGGVATLATFGGMGDDTGNAAITTRRSCRTAEHATARAQTVITTSATVARHTRSRSAPPAAARA